MKTTILKTTMVLAVSVVFFTGCETTNKFNEVEKKGVSCEDKGALSVLKNIVDKKFNGDFEIEKDNIVIWDYNAAGRYTCKAKIKKIGERKAKKVVSKNDTENMLAVMNQILAPAQYGIAENGGWVNYYTYVTTASTKENRHLYVQIFTEESGD